MHSPVAPGHFMWIEQLAKLATFFRHAPVDADVGE
jgi:hypothetical protein